MNSSMEASILHDKQMRGLDDEQQFRVQRIRALLSDAYLNYRWLEKRIQRGQNKKGTKFQRRVEKLTRRQRAFGERIDDLEETFKNLVSM